MRGVRTAIPLLLAVLLVACFTATDGASIADSSVSIQGDSDCSQGVGIEDVTVILEQVASLRDEVPCSFAANVNCDGVIDAHDALVVLRFSADLEADGPAYCDGVGDPLGALVIAIDPSLEPSSLTVEPLDGGPPVPVESAVDPNGVQVDFVSNEIVYKPDGDQDLADFLSEFAGTVLRDGTMSLPGDPEAPGLFVGEIEHGYHVLKVDSELSDAADLREDLADVGMTGKVLFSSDNAARLMAIATGEPAGKAQLNGVLEELGTSDHPTDEAGMFYMNFENLPKYKQGSSYNINVTGAWAYMRYQGALRAEDAPINTPVGVVVIDMGFNLHANTGLPLGGNLDYFPQGAKPLQYDLADEDYSAGGTTDGCGGACPYHGGGAFGVCCAIPNNFYGGAGTAGGYIVPVLFRIDNRMSTLADAVRLANSSNADVITMSVAGTCGLFCGWFDGDIGDATDEAGLAGKILLAGAGNDKEDISDDNVRPCEFPKVICVGSIDEARDNYYNWGTPVDIWAPFDLYSTVTPDRADDDANHWGTDEVYEIGGTSSSTPFVAGIAAMMKTLNPNLNYVDVRRMLQESSNLSPDTKVAHGFVYALGALMEARPNQPPTILGVPRPQAGSTYGYAGSLPFRVEFNDPEPGAERLEFADDQLATFTTDTGDVLCQTSVTYLRDGVLGFECVPGFAPLGTFDVTVTVIDPFGAEDSVVVPDVTFVNTPPAVEVLEPTDGSTFYATQTIEFGAYVFDPEEPIPFPQDRIRWVSDVIGEIGMGSTFERMLPQGDHTITVTATDTRNVATIDAFTLHILSGAGVPTVTITSPAENPYFWGPTPVTLAGNATDLEDGALTGASLEWYSNIDGFLGIGNQITVTLSGGSNCADYRDHIVTLQATDSDNNAVTDQTHVVVALLC